MFSATGALLYYNYQMTEQGQSQIINILSDRNMIDLKNRKNNTKGGATTSAAQVLDIFDILRARRDTTVDYSTSSVETGKENPFK